MSERSAIKRCSSLIMVKDQEEIKRNRKTTKPLLVLLHKGSYKSRKDEFLRQSSKDGMFLASPTDSDLIGSFGMTEESELKNTMNWCRKDAIQTSSEISTYILGSLESSCPLAMSPVSASDKSSFWINTVSNLSKSPSCLSIGRSFSSVGSTRPSLSLFSSSYTSWTKPIAGHKISDSCFPASSILDNDVEDEERDRASIKLRRKESMVLRRASSSDTDKDIDDIDDFELDGFDDYDLPMDDDIVIPVYEGFEDGKDKRLSRVMSSPDLAYGSMNGSVHYQDGD